MADKDKESDEVKENVSNQTFQFNTYQTWLQACYLSTIILFVQVRNINSPYWLIHIPAMFFVRI